METERVVTRRHPRIKHKFHLSKNLQSMKNETHLT